MSTIHLVRHGQKLPTAGDPGLTELGKQQARETGLFLQQFPIVAIYSSPFTRTVETAEAIGDVLSLKISTHPELAERMNWGAGIPWPEFLSEWQKATTNRQYQPKYGDSSSATGKRMQQFAAQAGGEDQHIVLVSHGGSIVDLLRNLFAEEQLEVLRMTNELGFDYRMPHCAVSTAILSDTPVLERLQHVEHLSTITE